MTQTPTTQKYELCPTCRQPLPNTPTIDLIAVSRARKYKEFKGFDYDNRTMNALKMQLDIMTDSHRELALDGMFRVMQDPTNRELRGEILPTMIHLYRYYCTGRRQRARNMRGPRAGNK